MYNDDSRINFFCRSEIQSGEMISENFKYEEWMCKCGKCEEQPFHHNIFQKLEQLRSEFGGRPITITSGYRCPKHNAAVLGASKSRHMVGDAADIKVRGKVPLSVAEMAHAIGFTGIKTYQTWTHIDLRPGEPWFDYP